MSKSDEKEPSEPRFSEELEEKMKEIKAFVAECQANPMYHSGNSFWAKLLNSLRPLH